MDLSNWKFKKSLESMESYPDSRPFKLEIEHGNRQILVMVTRQMEIILTEPNQNPFSKFLSLRFCREMMLLGEPQVIASVEKLVPAIHKICSYRLDSTDPNRGSTYFQNHPSFLKANPKEKENLKLLGSSLLIICLESMRVWAGWVPVAQNGSQSVFKKGYNSLIERGVTFCAEDKYYKKTDQEKFNNTYKVQFFETSQVIDQPSQAQSSQRQSPLLKQQLTRLEAYRRQLQLIVTSQRPTTSADLQKLKTKIAQFHQRDIERIQKNIQSNSKSKLDEKNNLDILFREQNWCQTFLSNYGMLMNRKISLQQFAGNCLKDSRSKPFDQIQIQPEQAIQSGNFKKPPLRVSGVDVKQQIAAALKQQKGNYENTIRRLEVDLAKRDRQIEESHKQFEQIITKTKQQHEARINSLKGALAKQSSANTQTVDKERELQVLVNQLREENIILRKQLQTPPAAIEANNKQIYRLQQEIKALKKITENQQQIAMQCEKQLSRRQNKIGQLIEQAHNDKVILGHLQQQNKELRIKVQSSLIKYQHTAPQLERMTGEIEKLLKQKINLQDQVNLYKQQLGQLRGKQYNQRDGQIQKLEQTNVKLKKQIDDMRKQLQMQIQIVTLKQVQIVRLKEQSQKIAREARQAFLNQKNVTPLREVYNSPLREQTREIPSGYKTYVGSGFASRGSTAQIAQVDRPIKANTHTKSPWRSPQQSLVGMEEFYNSFLRMSRQSYLRFCKACLKNKQLLYKENELEIGVISEKLSASKVKFIIHYTNNSQTALTDFKAKLYSPRTIRTAIVSDVSTLIDPAEQQKQQVTHEILQYPIRKVGLELNFNKRGKKQTLSLLLPVLILKFVDYKEPHRQPSPNLLEKRQSMYNTKVIQPGKTIKSYIPEFRQSASNVFDVEVCHKHFDLNFFLRLIVKQPNLIIEAYGEPLTAQLTKILQQYLNSLQMVLSK